jgi:hypothetical protein
LRKWDGFQREKGTGSRLVLCNYLLLFSTHSTERQSRASTNYLTHIHTHTYFLHTHTRTQTHSITRTSPRLDLPHGSWCQLLCQYEPHWHGSCPLKLMGTGGGSGPSMPPGWVPRTFSSLAAHSFSILVSFLLIAMLQVRLIEGIIVENLISLQRPRCFLWQ